jgi:AraC family transcriptional regulator of adaptative response / DNA-3-methyladenine glycosylase II
MGVDALADQLGVSARQLRRVLRDQVGASPLDLANHRRLLLSRQLIATSSLSLAQIAFASGFRSIRRFNDAFSRRFGRAPSTLRRSRATSNEASFNCSLPFRPPMAWGRLLAFLAGRAIPGVEHVSDETYSRTLRVGDHTGWVSVGSPVASVLPVTVSVSLAPALLSVLGRLRTLFDTDAHPAQIADVLGADPSLSDVVTKHPGLRVPGTVDALELSCRAIVGQQISVRAATTLAGRLASLGDAIEGAPTPLVRLFPTARQLVDAGTSSLTDRGIIGARARSIQAIATALHDGSLVLEPGSPPEAALEQLQKIPGIGPWTARMIAMRALRWPDAFPVGDAVLQKITAARNDRELATMAQRWSPWGAYAALYLWEMASEVARQQKEKQP